MTEANLKALLETGGLEAAFMAETRLGREFTYADLKDASEKLGFFLSMQGVKVGDRVAYVTVNASFFFPLLFACASRGAALVPLNPGLKHDEREKIVKDVNPRIVFYDKEHAAAAKFSIKAPSFEVDLDGAEGMLPAQFDKGTDPKIHSHDPDRTVLIVFTSGTTGGSKGVMLTHKNLLAMSERFVSVYGFRADHRLLCLLPFYHINAPMITGIVCIRARASVVLGHVYGLKNARDIWNIAERNKVNVLSLTPSIMHSLLQMKDLAKGKKPSIEMAMVGTAKLDEPLWKEFEETFGIPCYQGYGLTETTTWATMTPKGAAKRYDTSGLPLGCEIRIEPREILAASGYPEGSGEVLFHGDIIMKGYFANKKMTDDSFEKGGWLKSGDIGYIDADGQLVIVGRIKSIIKRRGILIVPRDIDAAMLKHPEIAESCTIGIADEALGERVVTAVRAHKKGVSEAELRAYVMDEVSSFKVPDEIVMLERIPKNDLGKIAMGELRKILSGDMADEIAGALHAYPLHREGAYRKDELKGLVHGALIASAPLRLNGFWGARSAAEITSHDLAALDALKNLADLMQGASRAARFGIRILFGDTHGRANGIPLEVIDSYAALLKKECEARGFEYERMSGIMKEGGLAFEDLVEETPEVRSKWEEFVLREQFIDQASKRVEDKADAPASALRYFAVTSREKPILEKYLDGELFFTYNDSRYMPALPDMPTVFLYPSKKGRSDKPWFMR